MPRAGKGGGPLVMQAEDRAVRHHEVLEPLEFLPQGQAGVGHQLLESPAEAGPQEGQKLRVEAVIKGGGDERVPGDRLVGPAQGGQAPLYADPEREDQHPEEGHRIHRPLALDKADRAGRLPEPGRREQVIQKLFDLPEIAVARHQDHPGHLPLPPLRTTPPHRGPRLARHPRTESW